MGTKALEELPVRIIQAQSLDIDAVSGATITSNSLKFALKDALLDK